MSRPTSERSPRIWIVALLIAAAALDLSACFLMRIYRVQPRDVRLLKLNRYVNSRGQWLKRFIDLKIYDAQTEKLQWSAALPHGISSPVGDHYLVGVLGDRIEAIDIDDALAFPINDNDPAKHRPVRFQTFGVKVEGLPTSGDRQTRFFGLRDSSRFVIQSFPHTLRAQPGQPPSTVGLPNDSLVCVCEIKDRTVHVLAKWTCADNGLLVLPDCAAVSQTADGKQIEFRTPDNYQVSRAYPANSWVIGYNTRARNLLYSYPDALTGRTRVCRLDDMSLVPELDIPLCPGIEPEQGDDRRYHILSDAALENSTRLVVYDAIDRRVAFESTSVGGWMRAMIKNSQLRLTSRLFGMTTQVIDLNSGRHLFSERPLMWVILATPCLLIAALAWLNDWMNIVRVPPALLGWNMLLLGALFVLPLALRSDGNPYWYLVRSAPNEFTIAAVLVLFFLLAIYVTCGRVRPLMGAAIYIGCMSSLLIAIDELGLVNLDQKQPIPEVSVSLRIFLTFCIVAVIVLVGMRFRGWRIDPTAIGNNSREPAASVRLLDYFLLTTSLALALKALGPLGHFLLDSQNREYVLGRGCWFVGCALVGTLALVDNARLQALVSKTACAIALVAIVDITAHVSFELCWRQAWYQAANDARYPVFTMLGSYACCRMMNRSGLAWRGRVGGPLTT